MHVWFTRPGVVVQAAGVLAALGVTMLAASSAQAQGFTAKSDERLSRATVRAGSQTNAGRGQRLRIGIEQCLELTEEDDATFRFEFDRRVQTNPSADADAAIFEFDAADGVESSCSSDVPDDACSGVERNNENVTITENEQVFEVRLPFDFLQTFDDDTSEPCRPPSERSDGQQSLTPPPVPPQDNSPDAGSVMDGGPSDTGPEPSDTEPATDTSDDPSQTPTDTGSSSDARDRFDPFGDGDSTSNDGSGTSSTAGGDQFDRIYVLRAFMSEPSRSTIGGTQQGRQFRVDGVIWLDRTRPGAVRGVPRARASENTLVVEFTPPSDEDDVQNYHVFYSNEPIDTRQPAADLLDEDGVERTILTGVGDGGDTRIGEIEVDRTPGNTLHVALATRDAAQNFSSVTALDGEIEVEESINFWDKYQKVGGAETGCHVTPSERPPLGIGGGLLMLALLGLRARRLPSERP